VRECVTASGRFGVPGPFDSPATSRNGFHAERAERCPASITERLGLESSPPRGQFSAISACSA